MNTYKRLTTFVKGAAVSLLVLASAGTTLAADAPMGPAGQPSKELREKMAVAHEKMAACLRSDSPVGDCHNEMMKNCREIMGGQDCGMMRRGKGMRMHDNPMAPMAPSKPAQ